MRAQWRLLFVELGEDLDDHGGEDHQHADPHREHTGILVAKVEADGQQDHSAQNRNEHGVERRHRNHGDCLVEMNDVSLGRFCVSRSDVYQN